MENKDTKADYQIVVRAEDQKWEMVEINIWIIYFIWDSLHYFLYIQGIFKSPLKKITPTRSVNSHSKSQFDLSSYYINLLKKDTTPLPRWEANYEILLNRLMYIFNCNKTRSYHIEIFIRGSLNNCFFAITRPTL